MFAAAGKAGRRGTPIPWRYPGTTQKVERSFGTRREAENWLTHQQAALLTGMHIDPRQSDRPFAEVLDAWRESWDGRLSPTTARRYQSIIDNYLAPEFGRHPIGSISHELVQRYVTRLAADSGLAPGRSATCRRTADGYGKRCRAWG